MRRRGNNLVVRNRVDVISDGRVDIGQRANDTLGFGPLAGAYRRRTLWLATPAVLQFVNRGIEFPPLATAKKAPLQGVLQPSVIFALATPRNLSSRSANIEPVENRMMPGAVIGALANKSIESAPGVRGDRFAPAVEVLQNPAHAPKRTGVLD